MTRWLSNHIYVVFLHLAADTQSNLSRSQQVHCEADIAAVPSEPTVSVPRHITRSNADVKISTTYATRQSCHLELLNHYCII